MENTDTEDTVSRLAGLKIEQDPTLALKGKEGYEEALKSLKELTLGLICGEEIAKSISLQAALITAINTGKRAFKGGVKILIGKNTPSLITWPNQPTLNKIIEELHGEICDNLPAEISFTLTFGVRAKEEYSLQVISSGWRGGVCSYTDQISLGTEPDFALGGVLAGSLGVGLAFLKVSGEKIDADSKNVGVSLWKPELNWLDKNAVGPKITALPQKYWFVGLGHLGQAYVWTLSLLPFKDKSKVSVFLQDTESVSKSNIDTGLLSEIENVGTKKTRICNTWLEKRGFFPTMIERNFDKSIDSKEGEPLVIIRGLDSVKARKDISVDKFVHVVDCGIGGTRSSFDSIAIYNLPTYKEPVTKIWDDDNAVIRNKANEEAMKFLGCGLYNKTISTSFVGAFASTLVLAEIIRAGYQGTKTSSMSFSMRNLEVDTQISTSSSYETELVRNGFI